MYHGRQFIILSKPGNYMAKQITPKNRDLIQDNVNYSNLLEELNSILAKGQAKAYKAVDNFKVETYWFIGERIVREELKQENRAEYGLLLIENLAFDLGFKLRRLYEIVNFYRAYPNLRTLSAQLSWSHYIELSGIDDLKRREFYQNKAIQGSWGVRELKTQIKSQLFENTSQSEIDFICRATLNPVNKLDIFKETYNFGFIDFQKEPSEKELENSLVDNLIDFLQEIGDDFSIAGRQVPIKIDGKTHYIDLVLYHRGIPCNILMELKIGEFNSRDIGQMNKYVNYYRLNKQYKHENDTIGLILCKHAGKEEVQYALGGLEEKIFIAKYKVKLPSNEKLKQIIKNI